ncbi:MAG: RDD family protein, partial [Stackebrandtia sp.]
YRRASARLAASRAVTAQVWDTLYGPKQGQAMWTNNPAPVWSQAPTTLPQVPAPVVRPPSVGAW